MSGVVRVSGLVKRYGRTTALAGVSFELAPGELVGLIGHNGAGKSTLLKLLTGHLLPTEGTVEVAGVDVAASPGAARAKMGVVPEELTLWDYLTAREFFEFVADVRGVADPREGVERAVSVSGLGADADRLVREYSQGMRRRTMLAAALLARPPVLLLDEALNGLDPPSAAAMKDVLRAEADRGAAVLLSTHVVETVERVADRVILLANGRVADDLRVADLPPGGLERLFLERVRK